MNQFHISQSAGWKFHNARTTLFFTEFEMSLNLQIKPRYLKFIILKRNRVLLSLPKCTEFRFKPKCCTNNLTAKLLAHTWSTNPRQIQSSCLINGASRTEQWKPNSDSGRNWMKTQLFPLSKLEMMSGLNKP